MLRSGKKTYIIFYRLAIFIFLLLGSWNLLFSTPAIPIIFIPDEQTTVLSFSSLTSPINLDGTLIDKLVITEVNGEKLTGNKLAADTSGNKENSITKLYPSNRSDLLNIELELSETDQRLQISVYNLLGKVVVEPEYINPSSNKITHQLSISSLPNGVYLCVVLGKNFRLREKFIISR